MTLALDGFVLVSWWKAILFLVPFAIWARVVSATFDKHAKRFHLGFKNWNTVHIIFGVVAIATAYAMPLEGELGFWIGLVAMIAILAIDVMAFAFITNKDERVPEDQVLKLDMSALQEKREAKAASKRAGTAELEIVGADKMKLRVPDSDTPDYATRLASEAPMLRAMEMNAQQVDIGPTGRENQYATSFLIDGVRQSGDPLAGPEAVQVIDFWKQAAGLSTEDRRRRQIGDLTISKGVDKHNLRVTSSGTQQGMRLTARFDPAKSVRRDSDDLGMTEAQMETLRAIVADGQGVVLLAAPSHAGRTTTLYSIVKMHDAYTRNVQTIELASEDILEGVKQTIFNPYAEGADFAMLVRSTLRRDPDVVGVCDLPDASTAKIISQSDHERTRVYVSIRAESALQALQMWTKAVGDADVASSCLRGVVAQRLVRRLCTNCRVAYQPPADMLRKLGLKPESVKQLFKEGGQVLIKNKPEVCPVCQGLGYRGQTGLFEVYSIDTPERSLIASGDFAGLRSELRKKRLPSIQQVALLKTVEGVTSINEITRTSGEKKKAPAKQPTPAS